MIKGYDHTGKHQREDEKECDIAKKTCLASDSFLKVEVASTKWSRPYQ